MSSDLKAMLRDIVRRGETSVAVRPDYVSSRRSTSDSCLIDLPLLPSEWYVMPSARDLQLTITLSACQVAIRAAALY